MGLVERVSGLISLSDRVGSGSREAETRQEKDALKQLR